MKWHELEAEQGRDLDYKIEMALRVIREAFAMASRPALAFSGGKDSTVLLDLIRRFFPELFAKLIEIYGNTGVEYPESVQFVRWLKDEWQLQLYEARPGNTVEPGLKYAGQRLVWKYLIENGRINWVLKQDGKLKSTQALERAAPEMWLELESKRLVWPAGSKKKQCFPWPKSIWAL